MGIPWVPLYLYPEINRRFGMLLMCKLYFGSQCQKKKIYFLRLMHTMETSLSEPWVFPFWFPSCKTLHGGVWCVCASLTVVGRITAADVLCGWTGRQHPASLLTATIHIEERERGRGGGRIQGNSYQKVIRGQREMLNSCLKYCKLR